MKQLKFAKSSLDEDPGSSMRYKNVNLSLPSEVFWFVMSGNDNKKREMQCIYLLRDGRLCLLIPQLMQTPQNWPSKAFFQQPICFFQVR